MSMRFLLRGSLAFAALFAFAAGTLPAAPDDTKPKLPPLPKDVAAAHPDGKWTIKRATLYRYLARYSGRSQEARKLLADLLAERFIEGEAKKRKLQVTNKDVNDRIARLDAQIREVTGGKQSLETQRKEAGMSKRAMWRQVRAYLLRKKVALHEFRRQGAKKKVINDSEVSLAIGLLFEKAKKVLAKAHQPTAAAGAADGPADGLSVADLPPGVVAMVDEEKITEYRYGRHLTFHLGFRKVLSALKELIRVEEAKLLLGPGAPSAEELAAQKVRFRAIHKNNMMNRGVPEHMINEDVMEQFLRNSGLSFDIVFQSPAFLAEARVRGHFERSLKDPAVRTYYGENKERYSDRLKVARIFIHARGQRSVSIVGTKIRSLERGRHEAQAIWIKADAGEDWRRLVRKFSEDPKKVREAGGEIPFWIRADNPAYKYTYDHAKVLKAGAISKPYFNGRGFEIVKLLKKQKKPKFEEIADQVRADAATQLYRNWVLATTRAARTSESLIRTAGLK